MQNETRPALLPSLITFGALCCLMGVLMSAFGWHALGGDTFVMMAGQYQVWHGLGLVALALTGASRLIAKIGAAGFLGGQLLFCGSLYALGISGEVPLNGAAPVGGVLLMLGWASLAFAGWQRWRRTSQG
ncbi:MAG: DUF423 domain-containing protein [Magnetovibrionaceae bacterium]